MSGYSGTPLIKKLGIKDGFRLAVINPPSDYYDLLGPLPEDVKIVDGLEPGLNFVHIFTNELEEMEAEMVRWKDGIEKNGMIWVSWYKKASKLPSEITEDFVRDTALAIGLVDVKVCAVDEKWSGLKLVIRLKDR